MIGQIESILDSDMDVLRIKVTTPTTPTKFLNFQKL
jgi:hypothetical protein